MEAEVFQVFLVAGAMIALLGVPVIAGVIAVFMDR
jgi:hypothetical protein